MIVCAPEIQCQASTKKPPGSCFWCGLLYTRYTASIHQGQLLGGLFVLASHIHMHTATNQCHCCLPLQPHALARTVNTCCRDLLLSFAAMGSLQPGTARLTTSLALVWFVTCGHNRSLEACMQRCKGKALVTGRKPQPWTDTVACVPCKVCTIASASSSPCRIRPTHAHLEALRLSR